MAMDLNPTGKEFTKGWFRHRNQNTFIEYVHPEFSGKPVIYLELGVFEGMSLTWMFQKVLTHPDSRAVGIDPWVMVTKIGEEEMERVRQRAIHNLDEWKDRCKLYRATSAELLRVMVGSRRGVFGVKRGTVDISMIDGNHNALAVWDDARLVYQLLKVGGIAIFDDVENLFQKVDHVREGIDRFLAENKNMVLAWKHSHCEAYRKIG